MERHSTHGVDPRWHAEFDRFVTTGDAEPEFLDYLNGNPDAQRAVEQAFAGQASALSELATSLKSYLAADAPAVVQQRPLGGRWTWQIAAAAVVSSVVLLALLLQASSAAKQAELRLATAERQRYEAQIYDSSSLAGLREELRQKSAELDATTLGAKSLEANERKIALEKRNAQIRIASLEKQRAEIEAQVRAKEDALNKVRMQAAALEETMKTKFAETRLDLERRVVKCNQSLEQATEDARAQAARADAFGKQLTKLTAQVDDLAGWAIFDVKEISAEGKTVAADFAEPYRTGSPQDARPWLLGTPQWKHATIVASVLVNEDGKVLDTEILKTAPNVDGKRLVESSIFKPATFRGRPVKSRFTFAIPLVFDEKGIGKVKTDKSE